MSLTIGQQLKNARIDRNLSLEDVFKSIRIRINYLEALEADDFSVMPSPVQGRGFLRIYAQFLALDIDAMLDEIRQSEQENIDFAKVDEALTEEAEPVEADVDAAPVLDDEPEQTPFWRQLLDRFGVSLASPAPAPAQEVDAAPITEADPPSAPETVSAYALPADRIKRPTPKFRVEPREFDIPPVVYDYIQSAPPLPLDESHIIFNRIGAALRERREMLSLTYEEIDGHLHLRPHYLIALEAGDFDALPSPVQTRGMLSNYADFLDLDSDSLLLQFAEGLQAQRLERNPDASEMQAGTRKRRKFSFGGFIAPDLIFGGGVIVLMVAFAVWGLSRIANSRAEDALLEATAPSIAEVLMSTSTIEVLQTPSATQVIVNTPGGEVGTAAPLDENLPEDANLGVQILVTVLERSWMRVTVDGDVAFEGRAQPNATFVYEGNEIVEVLTANGAGVRIGYNQRDLGLMGGFGEVVQRLYGPRGLLTPTVTPTSAATGTPTQTPTQTASPTSTPTATETASE